MLVAPSSRTNLEGTLSTAVPPAQLSCSQSRLFLKCPWALGSRPQVAAHLTSLPLWLIARRHETLMNPMVAFYSFFPKSTDLSTFFLDDSVSISCRRGWTQLRSWPQRVNDDWFKSSTTVPLLPLSVTNLSPGRESAEECSGKVMQAPKQKDALTGNLFPITWLCLHVDSRTKADTRSL